MIGKRFSHYRIVVRIGAGGMGEVYRARDEHLPRDVAIKILPTGTLADDQARRRFRKEAETLSQLNHPHIATIYDFDTQDDVDFLVMEYVEGATLAARLQGGPLPMDEVLRIGSQIAEALDEAHHHGIVHRDLKPKNIGLTLKGQVKVLDFGLARALKPTADASTTETLTGATGLAGTLPYMAPEQLRGAPPDRRSDVYALGVCLYEMSTGRRPFEQNLASALIDDILHAVPESPCRLRSEIPPGLEQIMVKCLEKDPELRYQSARDIVVDLHRMSAPSLGQELLGKGSTQRRGRRSKRRLSMVFAAALVIVAGVIAIAGGDVEGLWNRLSRRPQLHRIESVVALPSAVVATEDDRFLTDAIPRTLSTYLIQVQGLETKLPPTSIEMEKVGGDLDKVAKAYGVTAFVLSTVTARSDKLALSVQLVEAQTRRLVWSREYDGDRQGYLDVVRAAAEGLREAMRPDAATLPPIDTPSEPEIWFQRGLHYSGLYNHLHRQEDFDRALGAFEKTIELDPTRADAAAELGTLHIFKWESGSQDAKAQVEGWVNRALQLDPRTARAWDALSYLEARNGNEEAACLAGLRAASLAPNDAGCQISLAISLSTICCRLDLEANSMAEQLDPLFLHPLSNVGLIVGYTGRADEGLRLLDRVLDLEPDMPVTLVNRGILLLMVGRIDEATSHLERLDTLVRDGRLPPSVPREMRDLLTVAARQGDWGLAVERLQESETQFVHHWREFLVRILARHDEFDVAHSVLEHQSNPPWVPAYDWLMLCPDLEPLRADPRFEKIASTSRARFERLLQIFAEARSRNEFPAYLEKPLADLLVDLGIPDHP